MSWAFRFTVLLIVENVYSFIIYRRPFPFSFCKSSVYRCITNHMAHSRLKIKCNVWYIVLLTYIAAHVSRRMSRGMVYRLLYNFYWTFWGFRNHFPLWTVEFCLLRTRSQELIRGTGGLVWYNLAHSMAMHKVRFKTKSWGEKEEK